MVSRFVFAGFCWLLASYAWAEESTHRLYDGLTTLIHNAEGKDFQVHLQVRDCNLWENGPREILCKIYDPEGKAVVRRVIADDGVVSPMFLPPMGAWDHEAWYYAYTYMKGTQPMIRWSAFSATDRLKSLAKRDFSFKVPGGKKGIYRMILVGCIDHYVTLNIDPELPHGSAGQPDWIHGHGDQWQKSFVYLPQGTKGLHIMLAEFDRPHTRNLKVTGPDGKILFNGVATGGYTKELITFEESHENQLLTVEVGPGPNDFLLGLKIRLEKDPEIIQRGERVVTAVLCKTPELAKILKNGAIQHDGKVFWQPFQVRFHDWLKSLPPEAFVVKDAQGEVVAPAPPYPLVKSKDKKWLPTRPGYVVLNGPYMAPTPCDKIMHHYPAHKNRAALNLALKNLAAGLRAIGPNDHVGVATGGPFANMAYEFSNYAWHYWRAGWRVLQESDAPDEVKDIVREAFLVCGDRLSFCRTWERVNGNSFSLILTALRYCHEGTRDPLQKELFETYWDRFTQGGWGERAGVGKSGGIQEGFGYDHHYGSYILTTWQSILADLPEERFQKVYDRLRTLYSYTLADERVPAGPWSARTNYYPHWFPEKEGPFQWKGFPGDDFTVNVNDGNEFFAARRKGYYALTYHGRLSPKWESNAHAGQTGYGGGILCQFQVPGKGIVLASTLNGSYGEGMDISLWRNFHLHGFVGTTVDGMPLVAADSEHLDARLEGTTLTSSGEVRHNAVLTRRSYEFGPDGITCSVKLEPTGYSPLLNLWVKNEARGKLKEGFEMIPFVPKQKPQPKIKGGETRLTAFEGEKEIGPITQESQTTKTVVIDRGGFGVRIELDQPRPVLLGQNHTLLIRLVDQPTPPGKVELTYRLIPFGY